MLCQIRIHLAFRYQLASTQWEVIGDIRRATAQHTPRVRVQVRLTDALPTSCVDSATT